MSDKDFDVRPIVAADKGWVVETLETHWSSTMMVSRGVLHDISAQGGFAAVRDGLPVGLLTYNIIGDECEITLMQSMRQSSLRYTTLPAYATMRTYKLKAAN